MECGIVVCASQPPSVVVLDYFGEPVQGKDVVQFRLLYSGRVLGSSRSGSDRTALKHEIRRTFHPQLRRLWKTNHNLRDIQFLEYHNHFFKGLEKLTSEESSKALKEYEIAKKQNAESMIQLGQELMAKRWNRCGLNFIPLVTERIALRCSLDILFLRPEEEGMIIQGGDIDNRIKTVFDALRMPKSLDEIGHSGPQEDEDPFYCLLEDDSLISEVRVTTDQLLLLPHERDLKPNDAFLVIKVDVKPIVYSMEGLRFI